MHIGKECAISYGVSFALPKDSIFTEKFGEVILNIWHLLELAFPCIESFFVFSLSYQVLRHLSEAGLTRKWVDDRMDAVAKLSKTHRRSEVNPLTPRHLQARMH